MSAINEKAQALVDFLDVRTQIELGDGEALLNDLRDALAQASQARTDGGAVAWQYEFVDRPGHWFPVHRLDDLESLKTYKMLNLRALAVLATPPGNATQAAGAQWQPIETAPKDGRNLILLLTPSGFPQVAYSNTWWQGGHSVECKPTHWMPLPASPAAELKKD